MMTAMATRPLLAAMLLISLGACSAGGDGTKPFPRAPIGPVPPSAQLPGDPAAGWDTLVNDGYVSCGIPESVYSQVVTDVPASALLPGRNARNANLPYFTTSFTADSGVDLVSTNCLACHAGYFDGQLVVGLGGESRDFTEDLTFYAESVGAFTMTDDERVEWRHWADRVSAIAPYSRPHTVGANPADHLTGAIFAHLDPETLEWSDEPLMEMPPEYVVPSSPPPWWWMKKKNAMFYVGAGRGDHTRFMMLASSLCTDGIPEAQAINDKFDDVRAWISSLEAPAWPFDAPDPALVHVGERVFGENCSRCHGTYGPAGEYPNLIVGIEEVGTDPLIATAGTTGTDRFLRWFEESWYANSAELSPAVGYIAPPLDGVWATAPYLHNGSVPSIALLLNSPARPTYWTRTFSSTDYDTATLGWSFTALDHGKDGEADPDVRKRIYDTTQPGYSNSGHPFGDALSDADRAAVLEYLKTL